MDTYFPDAYGGPKLDFSGIQRAASGVAGGLTDMWDSQSVRSAWEESGGDFDQAINKLLARGDTDGAASLAKIRRVSEGDQNSRFGLQPIWDKDGNAYQLNSQGGAQRIDGSFPPRMNYVQTPQGVYPQPVQGGMPNYGGTDHQVYGSQEEADAAAPQVDQGMQAPQYGQPIPKNYATPEQQKEIGDSRGKAQQALPASKAMANRVIGAISKLENSPNLSSAIGPIQSRLPTLSDKTADVEADIQQAIGGTFTSAYESLRGAQAITDIEGTKATAAITRLQELKQSEPGYRQALSDAKYEVFNLHNIVRQKAGLPPEENPYPPPSANAPSAGGGNRTSKGIQWSIEP
jgi:hypothetical protein